MFPYLFSVGSEANVKQCVLFVLGRPAVYLLFISIIRNETCTFRISYNKRKSNFIRMDFFYCSKSFLLFQYLHDRLSPKLA